MRGARGRLERGKASIETVGYIDLCTRKRDADCCGRQEGRCHERRTTNHNSPRLAADTECSWPKVRAVVTPVVVAQVARLCRRIRSEMPRVVGSKHIRSEGRCHDDEPQLTAVGCRYRMQLTKAMAAVRPVVAAKVASLRK